MADTYQEIAVKAFELRDWITGTDTGGIEPPRIILGITTAKESSEKGVRVDIDYTYPETCGLSDCRYHHSGYEKRFRETYFFSDGKIFLEQLRTDDESSLSWIERTDELFDPFIKDDPDIKRKMEEFYKNCSEMLKVA